MCISIIQVFAIGHHSDVFTDWAVLFRAFIRRKPFALYVGLHPEVGEEDEEQDAVHPDQVDPHRNLVVTFLHEVVLADVNGDHDELHLWNNSGSKDYWRFFLLIKLNHKSNSLKETY